MDQDAKAKFILALHKHSLQAFDSGGGVNNYASPTSSSVGGADQQGSTASVPSFLSSGFSNPIGSAGGAAQGIGAAFTAQNGFQAGLAPTQTSDYGGTIDAASGNALNGYGQAQNIQAQQQALADQLKYQSIGQGPNPAQAALDQSTGQNVSNQAALMASQRGAGANAGLIARQAAMQGANTQQQAVGQSATLQAQQQLAAQQQLEAQQQAMGSQNIAEQGENAKLFGYAAGAQNTQNSGSISNYNNAQTINAATAQNNANAVNKTTGGLLNSAGSVLSMFMAEGGGVEMPDHLHAMAKIYHPHMYADGGDAASNGRNVTGDAGPGFFSGLTDLAKKGKGMMGGSGMSTEGDSTVTAGGDDAAMAGAALVAKGGNVRAANPKEKAVKKDNSYSNDKIPALLSEGEIVIPRSIAMHPMAPQKAAEFVQAVINKRKMGKK